MRTWRIIAVGIGVALVAGCERNGGPQAQPGGSKSQPTRTSSSGAKAAASTLKFELTAKGLPETYSWKCDPVLADVNGDGLMDMAAVPRLGDGTHVWLGNGKGDWTDSSTGLSNPNTQPCGGGLAFADVNNDRKMDLVRSDHCLGAFVYLGDGTGKWQQVTESLYPAELVPEPTKADQYIGAEDIEAADLNGDGNVDLITAASDEGGLNVFFGDGSGRNWKRADSGLPTVSWGMRVVAADMNQDGALDIVASYSKGPRVWRNDGKGHFSEMSTGLPEPIQWGIFMGIDVGDLNEDGRPDLAVSNWIDGPEVYLQQADGSWKKNVTVFPAMAGGSYGLATGDLNGDKHQDIAVTGRMTTDVGFVYGVFVLLGDGKGGFTPQGGTGLPDTGLAFSWGVTMRDFNQDGVPDLVAGSGGIVAATVDGPTQPSLKPRLLAWITHRGASAAVQPATAAVQP